MFTMLSALCFILQLTVFVVQSSAHSFAPRSLGLASHSHLSLISLRADESLNLAGIPDVCNADCGGLVNVVACGQRATECVCSTVYNGSSSACMACLKKSASTDEQVSLSNTLEDMYSTCKERAAANGGHTTRPAVVGATIIASFIPAIVSVL